MTKNAALQQRSNKLSSLKYALEKTRGEWLKTVPETMSRFLTADRVCYLMLLAASKKGSSIMDCSHSSVVRCVADALSMGLEPNGPLGHAYLVPFRNNGVMEAQLIIGYRGLIALARRSGEINSVEAHVVYKGDEFELSLGMDTTIIHRPNLTAERREQDIVAVYCVARFKDGGHHMDFMTRGDVDRIRRMSKSAQMKGSAWQEHYAEMAKKTVVRRAAKYWPLSSDLAAALSQPDQESPDTDDGGVIDMTFGEEETGTVPEAKDEAADVPANEDGEAAQKAAPAQPEPDDASKEPALTDYQKRAQRIMEKNK